MRELVFAVLVIAQATEARAEESSSVGGEDGVFLHSIQVTQSEHRIEIEDLRISLELRNSSGDRFGEISTRWPDAKVREGRVEIGELNYPKSADKVERRHRKASFVIDFKEPVFKEVAAEVKKSNGPKPSIEQLTAYVNRRIEKKTLKRGFDVASTVASKREGDCSEHPDL